MFSLKPEHAQWAVGAGRILCVSDVTVPRWAARARDLFRALLVVYLAMWVVRGVLTLTVISDMDLLDGGPPRWLDLTVYTLAGLWLASGLVWLAGALVAGYREPKK